MARTRADAVKLLDEFAGSGAYYGQNQTVNYEPKKPSGNNFFQNVGSSIGGGLAAIPKIAGSAVQGIANSFSTAGKAISQGLPIIGSIDREQKFRDARLGELSSKSDQALKDYRSGKISKQRYKTITDFVASELNMLGKDATDSANDMVDPVEAAKAIATVGTLPFAAGRLGGVGVGGKAGEVLGSLPGVQKAITATELAAKGSAARQAAVSAVKFLPKAILETKPTAEGAAGAVSKPFVGDFKGALVDAALTGTPAVFSAAEKVLKGVGSASKRALFSSSGLFDQISVGGKSVNAALKEVASSSPGKAKKFEDALRVAQDNIMSQYKGDSKAAAANITEYISGKNLKKMTLSNLVDELEALAKSNKKAQGLRGTLKKGETFVFGDGKEVSAGELSRLGAVKSTQKEKSELISLLKGTKTRDEVAQVVNKFVSDNRRFASNAQNLRVLESLQTVGSTGDDAVALVKLALKGTNKVMIKDASGNLKPVQFDNGYFLGLRSKNSVDFKNVKDTAELAKGHKASLGVIGDALRKAGISPEQQSKANVSEAYRVFRESFSEKVSDLNIPAGGNVLSKLEDLANTKTGVSDVRQLSWKEIQSALGTTDAQSKMVLSSLKKSMLEIPTELRGLAGKIQDINTAINPISSKYSRFQSVGRYEKNPFFRLQENAESRIGVAALTGTTAKPTRDYTGTINELEDLNIFSPGYAGEGASEGIGKITARLSRDQQRTIAAGFESLASKAGSTVSEFVSNPKNADLVDNMKAIVQYPEKGLTSSNFMKALNLATFPARYNIKVTQLAYKALRQRPGIEQVAVMNGLKNYSDFINSDEGIKWQSENSEVLGIMRYFTPIGSVESVIKLLSGKGQTVRDVGTIGGLPFGVVSSVLQGQGVVKLDSPYLDPKTGEPVPDKIPEDTKARLRQALVDIIGTMYTFPGRIINADSKRSVSEKAVDSLTLGALKDAKYSYKQRGEMTKDQQRTQSVLSAGSGKNLQGTNSSRRDFSSLGAFKKSDPQYRLVAPKLSSPSKKVKKRAVKIGQPF